MALENKGRLYLARVDSAKAKGLQPGHLLVLNGLLEPLPRPKHWAHFDYGKYLYYQGYSGLLKIESFQQLSSNEDPFNWIGKFREAKFEQLQLRDWEAAHKGIFAALFLGIRTGLSPDTKQNFQSAGIMHLLAISGLHLGMVYLLLTQVLGYLRFHPWGRFLEFGLVVSGLWIFALFTGASPSVLRAATLFSFLAIGRLLNRKSKGFRPLLASAVLLFASNPLLIHQLGFQLSYAAVLGILYLVPKLNDWFEIKQGLAQKLQQIVYVSIAAQAFTAPLSLYHFGMWPTYFLIANLLILPFIPLLMYSGFCLVLLPKIGVLQDWVDKLIQTLLWLSEEIASWPLAQIPLNLDLSRMILLYTSLLMLMLVVKTNRLQILSLAFMLLIADGAAQLFKQLKQRPSLKVSAYHVNQIVLFTASKEIPIKLGEGPEIEASYQLLPLMETGWYIRFGNGPKEDLIITKGHLKGDLPLTHTLLYWGNSEKVENHWKEYCAQAKIDFRSARSTFQVIP